MTKLDQLKSAAEDAEATYAADAFRYDVPYAEARASAYASNYGIAFDASICAWAAYYAELDKTQQKDIKNG